MNILLTIKDFLAMNNNALYIPLTILIFIDYITGICLALKNKKICSKIGYIGILRKILIYIVAILGRLIDCFLIADSTTVENMILVFYISNEGISILENLTQIGLPLPDRVYQLFSNLSKSSK